MSQNNIILSPENQAKLDENKEWFRNAGYGMMVNWGLYCLPGGEWKGK